MTKCFKCGATLIEACPNSLNGTKDKLESVEKWYNDEAEHGGSNPWWYNKRLRELAKILGVSEFNKKGEDNAT